MNHQSRLGVSSHVNGQGPAAPTSHRIYPPDLEDERRGRLLRLHSYHLAHNCKEPLPAHAAGEPVPEGSDKATVGFEPNDILASLGALCFAAFIVLWWWVLPAIGLLWLTGWL